MNAADETLATSPVTALPNLAPRDGDLHFVPRFLRTEDAARLFERLRENLAFEPEVIMLYGRPVQVPRLVCWYGDPEARYRYSGTEHAPHPWTPELLMLKSRIETFSGRAVNSVLGNLYRNGNDSMGWHADQERELGTEPFIASLSLGATRRFRLRHRSGDTVELNLVHGSLLLMGGRLQHHWRHCVPKTREPCGERINLTFRRIFPQRQTGNG